MGPAPSRQRPALLRHPLLSAPPAAARWLPLHLHCSAATNASALGARGERKRRHGGRGERTRRSPCRRTAARSSAHPLVVSSAGWRTTSRTTSVPVPAAATCTRVHPTRRQRTHARLSRPAPTRPPRRTIMTPPTHVHLEQPAQQLVHVGRQQRRLALHHEHELLCRDSGALALARAAQHGLQLEQAMADFEELLWRAAVGAQRGMPRDGDARQRPVDHVQRRPRP